MADSEKNSQMPREFLTRFTTTPKGQVTLVALSNGMNATSKAAFLAAATYLTTGEVFETFILMVVVIDAAAIVLDLGGSAGLIVTARDIPLDRRQAFYRRAQLFKLSYLIIAALAFQLVWGIIPAMLMIGVCLFEFQNTELQSNYRFLAQLARQATGFVLRPLGLIPLFMYEVDKNLMLVLFYAPQFLIGLSFLFDSAMNAQNPRSAIASVLSAGFEENREIYRIGRSSLLMEIAVLILRRGDVAFVTYFLGAAVAAKVGLLFTFAQFLPMFSNAVSKVMLPYVLDNQAIFERIRQDQRRIIVITVALAALIATPMTVVYILVFPFDKIVTWSVAWLVFMAIAANMVFQPISTTMYRKRAIGNLARIHLEQLVVQVVLSLSLIPLLGIYGVAISMVIVRLYGLMQLSRAVGKLGGGAL